MTTPAAIRAEWHDMPRSKRAGMLCKDEKFQVWLQQKANRAWYDHSQSGHTSDRVARAIMLAGCHIESRADLDKLPEHSHAVAVFDKLEREYRQAAGLEAEGR